MIRVLSVLLALGVTVVTAVREDMGSNLQAQAEAEAEEEMEMKLVPAKISKAIRKSMRRTAEATKLAEQLKANATEMSEKAEKKAQEAEKALIKANKMKEELEIGAKKLEEQKEEAEKLMEDHSQAQEAWKKENDKLISMEKELVVQNEKYDELSKKIDEQIKKLFEEKRQANMKVKELKKSKDKKKEEVDTLTNEIAAAGKIANKAKEAYEKADAKFKDEEKKCENQRVEAEKASTLAATSEAQYNQAKEDAAEADLEVQNRMATKQQVLELRNAVQNYYDATDLMTKSMEAALGKLSGGEEDAGKKPWDLMREDENVKKSMVTYNLMVAQFRRLFFENKDIYTLVADSTQEIHENAQAAWLLQCDPEEELEEEWKKSGSVEKLNEHCGVGLWKHMGVERQNFPSKGETAPPSETPEASKEEPTEEVTAAEPEESKEEVKVESKPEEEVSNAEPIEEENKDASFIQAKDLERVRQIRRHRQRAASL